MFIKAAATYSFGKFEDVITNMDDMDFPTKLTVQEHASILSLIYEESIEQVEHQKRLRYFLRSLSSKSLIEICKAYPTWTTLKGV